MSTSLSVAEILAKLEARIAHHEQQVAHHKQLEAHHREQSEGGFLDRNSSDVRFDEHFSPRCPPSLSLGSKSRLVH